MGDAKDVWRVDATVVVVAATWSLFLALAPFVSLRIDWTSFWPPAVIVVGLALLVGFYSIRRPEPRIAATARAAALMIAFSLAIALLNYFGFDLHRPRIDAELAAFDRALGFDWWGYVTAVKSSRIVGTILSLAYMSTQGQVVVAILILGFTGRLPELERLILAFMLGAIAVVATWCLFPSFGALPLAYERGMADAPFHLAMDRAYAEALVAYHGGALPVLRFETLVGLVGCPSFHTTMAVLTAWALRDVRFVAPVAVVLNLLVVAAVPADGGHHFVDAFAGLAVAVVAVVASRRLVRGREEAGEAEPRAAVAAEATR